MRWLRGVGVVGAAGAEGAYADGLGTLDGVRWTDAVRVSAAVREIRVSYSVRVKGHRRRGGRFRARGKALSCAGGAAELRHLRHRSDRRHGTGELRLLDYGLSSNELRLSLWGEGGELDILYCIPRERNDERSKKLEQPT